MKKLSSLILLLLSTLNYSQSNINIGNKDKIIYLDSTWSETNQNNYKYYKIVKDYKKNKDEYIIERYYFSGKIESKWISKNKDYFFGKSEITSFYENENLKSIITYEDNNPIGKCIHWYENGNKRLEGEYIIFKENGKEVSRNLKVLNYWDKNNFQQVIDGNGSFEDDENFSNQKGESLLFSISNGKVKNGFKDGIWIGHNKNYSFSEVYDNGKFISGESIDSENIKHFYTTILKRAFPAFGMIQYYNYILKNLKIPEYIFEKGGKILVNFTIDENGKLNSPSIIKGIDVNTDLDLLEILSKNILWIPQETRGITVSAKYILPISIPIAN